MRGGGLAAALGGILLACGGLNAAPPLTLAGTAQQDEAEDRVSGAPDFTAVTTKAAANRLVREGKLVKIHFFPTELGEPAKEPHNIGYITPEAAEARALLIGTLERFRDEGLIDQMRIVPDYKAESIIPTRIRFKAWHSQRDGGGLEGVVEVW